jgi:hypothetical protein
MKKNFLNNINQKLIGTSGSNLIIFFDKVYKIRKLSKTNETSLRLVKQYKKTLHLKTNKNFKLINFPQFYGYGYHKSNFYYDMQYINSENLSELILRNDYKFTKDIFQKVLTFVTLCKKKPLQNYYKPIIILNKIHDLEKKIYFKDRSFKKIFTKLKSFKWKNVQYSDSHGDLTFENILIKKNKIFFIDISSNFIDSFYLDLSKLLFDLICGWSFRNLVENCDNIEINFLKKFYIEFLYSNFTIDELELIKMFTLLDFIRVLNYSKKIEHSKLLKIKITHLYDNFNSPLLW